MLCISIYHIISCILQLSTQCYQLSQSVRHSSSSFQHKSTYHIPIDRSKIDLDLDLTNIVLKFIILLLIFPSLHHIIIKNFISVRILPTALCSGRQNDKSIIDKVWLRRLQGQKEKKERAKFKVHFYQTVQYPRPACTGSKFLQRPPDGQKLSQRSSGYFTHFNHLLSSHQFSSQ